MSTSDPCRRPVGSWEQPYLVELGRGLRRVRVAAGLTQQSLAARVGMSERSIRRLEHGQRRTRRSTLERLGAALAGALGTPYLAELLTSAFVLLAGPALAPEGEHEDRVAARRRRRVAAAAGRPVTQHRIVFQPVRDGTLELHEHRRWVTRTTVRQTEYAVFEDHHGRRRRLPTLPAEAGLERTTRHAD